MASTIPHWHRITRAEMKAWDDDMADVAMEATGYGWEGKFSARGHLIMRSPDGQDTMSVSKRSGKSSLQNTRASLARWKRTQPGSSFGDAAVKAAAGVEDVFEAGGPRFAAEMPADILAYLHRDGRVVEYMHRLLDDDVSVTEVKERLTLATEDDPDTLTVPGPWVVLDRLTHRAVAWGSAMTEADAYTLIYGQQADDGDDSSEDEMTDETTSEPEAEEPEAVETESDEMVTQIIRTWECDVCGATFDRGQAYAAHSKRHRDYAECVLCGARVKYLDTHLRRMHGASNTLETQQERTLVAVDQSVLEDSMKNVRHLLEAAALGIDAGKRVDALAEENARLRRENEEMKAKMQVLREAMSL